MLGVLLQHSFSYLPWIVLLIGRIVSFSRILGFFFFFVFFYFKWFLFLFLYCAWFHFEILILCGFTFSFTFIRSILAIPCVSETVLFASCSRSGVGWLVACCPFYCIVRFDLNFLLFLHFLLSFFSNIFHVFSSLSSSTWLWLICLFTPLRFCNQPNFSYLCGIFSLFLYVPSLMSNQAGHLFYARQAKLVTGKFIDFYRFVNPTTITTITTTTRIIQDT